MNNTNWGIRKKALMISIFPTLLAALCISIYMTVSRTNDIQENLIEYGHLVANNIESASEFALFSENKPLLKSTIDSFINDKIFFVTIRNKKNNVIVKSQSTSTVKAKYTYKINRTIFLKGIETGMIEGQERPENILGYIEIGISTKSVKAQLLDVQLKSAAITFFILAISIIISLRFGGSIIDRILAVRKAAKKLPDGNIVQIEHKKNGDEIDELSEIFNDMAKKIDTSKALLKTEITVATQTLHGTIIDLTNKNKELEIQRERAIKADQEKSNFLARMSHEMRSPINAISGFSNILIRSVTDDNSVEYAKNISEASKQMTEVVNDILGFSKLDSGVIDIEKVPFELGECIEDAVIMSSPIAHKKSLNLILISPHNINLHVIGDPSKIKHILNNLLSNAIKFTANGDVIVEIESTKSTTDNDSINIAITVSDQGIGVPDDRKRLVFDPFYQGDASITRQYGGTGLGLSIVKKIIESMHGEISIKDNSPHGSVFNINFPVGVIATTMGKTKDDEPSSLLDSRILIYDANPYSLRSIRNSTLLWTDHIYTITDLNQIKIDNSQINNIDIAIISLSYEEQNTVKMNEIMLFVNSTLSCQILFLVHDESLTCGNHLCDKQDVKIATKPIRRKKLYELLANAPSEKSRVNKDFSRTSFTALIAEDNAFNRELIDILIKEMGGKTYLAKDGQEALDLANAVNLDIIITDIHLPVIDGVRLANNIKQSIKNPCTPIIALTADIFAKKENALNGDFVAWLLKPVEEDNFHYTINHHLKNSTLDNKPTTNLAQDFKLKNKFKNAIITHAQSIKKHAVNQQLAALKEETHQLSGLTGYYSMNSLCNQISELENICNNNETKEAYRLAIQLSKILTHYAETEL